MIFFVLPLPLILIFAYVQHARKIAVEQQLRTCPWCYEAVHVHASVCRACRGELPEVRYHRPINPWLKSLWDFFVAFVVIFGGIFAVAYWLAHYSRQFH